MQLRWILAAAALGALAMALPGETGAASDSTVRKSPTLGQKPPAGAVVLLECAPGKAPSLEKWANASWQANADGFMVKGKGDQLTKDELGDMQLHLEFNIPPGEDGKKPAAEGNSGIYIMDRYEIQILDSYGRKPGASECGAVYKRIAPKTNASLPAGEWQTYDITFHAPKFDAKGTKTQSVRVTVIHNGVKVQDGVEVTGPTGAASGKKEVPKAKLRLQDHGCPVKFRNIWYVVPKG